MPYLLVTNWKPVEFIAVVSGGGLGQSCGQILLESLWVSRSICPLLGIEIAQSDLKIAFAESNPLAYVSPEKLIRRL